MKEYVAGISAEHIERNEDGLCSFYEQLAKLMINIHRIPLHKFGYIGLGVPSHISFIGFMSEKIEELSAMAYNWIADIARLTYWMYFTYDVVCYERYRQSFLDQYEEVNDINLFNEVEKVFHVWIGMDHLLYFMNTPQYTPAFNYLQQCIAALTVNSNR